MFLGSCCGVNFHQVLVLGIEFEEFGVSTFPRNNDEAEKN